MREVPKQNGAETQYLPQNRRSFAILFLIELQKEKRHVIYIVSIVSSSTTSHSEDPGRPCSFSGTPLVPIANLAL
jgi:hypothetical protein